MRLNGWLLLAILIFALLELPSMLFWNTFAGVIALFVFLFSLFFFGFFVLFYVSSSFTASVNPWLNDVDEMDGPFFNRMYMPWLLENYPLEWAYWAVLLGILIAIPSGIITFAIVTSGGRASPWDFTTSVGGFMVGCAFLIFLAICWTKGFCEVIWKGKGLPQRRLERIAEEWKDKNL
jgi:hypothetical protein